ncbi:MAG TPA: hypothetical protein VKT33_07140 [Candidatus Angelobacter sp.]|nr:hypothetical protein [Candidatus Angelobacter sp.]
MIASLQVQQASPNTTAKERSAITTQNNHPEIARTNKRAQNSFQPSSCNQCLNCCTVDRQESKTPEEKARTESLDVLTRRYMWATIFGVAGGFIGIGVLIWQTVVTRTAANAAKASADYASAAVEATMSKERARIRIEVAPLNPQSGRGQSGSVIMNGSVCTLTNYGLTVSFIDEFSARCVKTDTEEMVMDYGKCRTLIYGESIEQGSNSDRILVPLEPEPVLSDDDIMKIRNRKSFIHFYGVVKFRDIFDRKWITTIHVLWTMRWGVIISNTPTQWWEPIGPQDENQEKRLQQ